MSIFHLFRKKDRKENNNRINEETSETIFENQLKQEEENKNRIEANEKVKKNINYDSKEERTTFLHENCEQIIEATRQVEEAKLEYHLVTSYLTDMQKIDQIPKEDRADLDDAARQIVSLSNERLKYQKSDVKITGKQLKHLEQYEKEIPTELKKMKENESYQLIIKNDMRQLEGEKGALKYQRDEAKAKQNYLNKLSIITSVLVILFFLLFSAISYAFEANVIIPFLLTIIMAAISAFYIFYEARKNSYDLKMIALKQNKAIALLNKVKIKYINNKNLLDYAYEKYEVNNYQEFQYLWEQYVKAKDEEKRYKKNTDLLNFYHEVLIKELKKYDIADPDIWVYQAIAIIDSKEMVEIRHNLNTRRQKLRERIDYNTGIKNNALNEIKSMIQSKNDWKDEITEVLSKYQIYI